MLVPPSIWWCCRTPSSRTLAWCATCTAGASRIFPFGCVTAPGWWAPLFIPGLFSTVLVSGLNRV